MVSDFLCGARRRRIATQNENVTQAEKESEERRFPEWASINAWLHNTTTTIRSN